MTDKQNESVKEKEGAVIIEFRRKPQNDGTSPEQKEDQQHAINRKQKKRLAEERTRHNRRISREYRLIRAEYPK